MIIIEELLPKDCRALFVSCYFSLWKIHALRELCGYSFYLFKNYTAGIYVCIKFEKGKEINRKEEEKGRRKKKEKELGGWRPVVQPVRGWYHLWCTAGGTAQCTGNGTCSQ
jgi:hypothetical protein